MIKEAEMLYKRINDIHLSLIRSRLNNDEEGNRLAIYEMETAMCNTFHFLKCIIDRKDNIVDLGRCGTSIIQNKKFATRLLHATKTIFFFDVHSQCDIDRFLRYNLHLKGNVYFSFVKDLLPKGGE